MKSIYRGYISILFFSLSIILTVPTHGETTSENLAIKLQHEGQHRSAAVEWRRMAMNAPSPEAQAGYYWAAAHQYLQAEDPIIAEKMLDAAEQATWDIEDAALPLRAEAATLRGDTHSATFYWNSLLQSESPPDVQQLAQRQLAALSIQSGKMQEARDYLQKLEPQQPEKLDALERYQQQHNKSPRLGGLLGIIPGLGYVYAGEYGNAVRSIILNSIFIFGMAHTAEEDQWGAFAAITFFELTWYSGSIYGGIDAAHRHNRNRLDTLLQEITGTQKITPDWNAIPMVSFQISF